MDQFYTQVTAASFDAAIHAKNEVAGEWRMDGISSAKAPRIRQKRKFFRAAKFIKRFAQQSAKKKKPPAGKVKPAAKAKAMIKPTVENYKRSKQGFELIKQQASHLLDLDRAAFPKNPLFDPESGHCRLRLLECNVTF